MRKLLSTTIAAGIFVSMGMTPVWADVVGATELPVYNSTGSSKVTVSDPFLDAADGKMTKNITIDKGTYNVGVANWDKFNIGKDAKVQVLFSSHHQTSINKVAQSGGLSQIYGSFVSGTSCAGCAYNETGKVILLNPNGVFFGNGANVDINSFTASNMKGTWEEDSNREGYITLKLSKYNSGELDSSVDNNYGIKVDKGATIKADTNLTFAANNIDIYNGSQISTNTTTPNITFVNNAATEAFGKVYLVTSDGVNFTYARHGGVESMDNKVANSENAMKLNINGDITTGHLEAHNYSKNIDSEISTNGALLKAVKAEKGNDGSILLVSNSRVVSTDSSIGAGGDLTMTAPQKVNIKNDNINVAGNITLTATDGNGLKYTKEVTKNNVKTTEEYTNDGNVLIDSSKVKAGKTVTLTTPKIAGIQNSSDVEANDIVINGGTFGQVTGKAKVNATNNVTIAANDIWFDRADVTAGNKISATAANNIYSWDAAGNNAASSFDAPTIELTATNGDVTSKYTGSTKIGKYNFNDNKTTINAGNDIDINVLGVKNKENGLVARAKNDVTVTSTQNLSISSLIAEEGDMTLKANKIIAGKNYVADSEKLTGTDPLGNEITDPVTDDRSYIYVKNGKFNTSESNDKFYVTASGDQDTTDATKFYRHHIEFGNGAEKFVLINGRPYMSPKKDDNNNNNNRVIATVTGYPSVNDQQASMLEKIPRQPEAYSNATQIADGRTTFVDVFAAASQIEIEDDED